MPRLVIPGWPHHITARGVRGFEIFRDDEDRLLYLRLCQTACERSRLKVRAYTLMPNHVHFVAEPLKPNSIADTFKWLHEIYATQFNRKYGLVGHLFQGRPYSSPMDTAHMWRAIRYVERNPVRAGIVNKAEDYPWSSAAARCYGKSDPLLDPDWSPSDTVPNWKVWLAGEDDPESEQRIRETTFTGRPCGDETFVDELERMTDRRLTPRKPGPVPKELSEDSTPMLWEE